MAGGKNAREKRKALFAANQAERTPEQLEEETRRNEMVSQRPLVQATANSLAAAKRWFMEFLEDQHSMSPDETEQRFFTPGGPELKASLFKEYARYLARSRTGRLSNKLSAHTLQSYMSLLFWLVERERQLPPRCQETKSLRLQLKYFVAGELTEEESLLTEMLPKPLANTEDVTFILSRMYSPNYLGTFISMRLVLNVNLFICLMIDLCGRSGEIAHNHINPEHMCLRWEDIEFYVFQPEGDGSFDIRALVKIRWAKGRKLDSSQHRIMPFHGLYPTSLALQDTLRLLLTCALMDGVLEQLRTWDDFSKIKLPADAARTGRRLPMKKAMLKVPVLRRLDRNRQLTNTPVQTGDLQYELRRLGKFCGFEHRLVAYCFRRGVAYVLSEQTNEVNRKYLMGHGARSNAFSAYQSKISTLDFPSMYRNLEPRSTGPLLGISLNRSDNAPARLSETALQSILNQPDIVDASAAAEAIANMIRSKHRSLAAAARTSDMLWEQYKTAMDRRRSLIDIKGREAEAQLYARHFEDLSPFADSAEDDQSTTPDDGSYDEDLMDAAMASIDPGMLKHGTAQIEDDLEEALIGSLADADVDARDDKPMDPRTDHSAGNHVATRLHGLPHSSFNSRTKRLARKGNSAYNDMLAELEAAQDHEARFHETLAKWFNIRHALDDFAPGQEPLPGTYLCRECGKNLHDVVKAYEHTHSCAKIRADNDAQALLEREAPSLDEPCTYQVCGHGKMFKKFVPCGETFDTAKERAEHMREHQRSMAKKGKGGEKIPTCFFGDCATNPEGGRLDRDGPDFESKEEQLGHMWSDHRLSTLKTASASYCDYCDTWLLEPHEWQRHALNHRLDAQAIISEVGYCGLTAGRRILPALCPFCFHDESLPLHVRLFTFVRESHPQHIAKHLEELQQDGARIPCPAYPDFCTLSKSMDALQLKDHLETVHKIDLPERHAKKVTKVSKAKKGDDAAKASRKSK